MNQPDNTKIDQDRKATIEKLKTTKEQLNNLIGAFSNMAPEEKIKARLKINELQHEIKLLKIKLGAW